MRAHVVCMRALMLARPRGYCLAAARTRARIAVIYVMPSILIAVLIEFTAE